MSENDPVEMRRRGKFQPKIIGTLRPCMMSLIGQTFYWEFVGTSDEDESYPGQTRWLMARRHDDELEPDQIGRWTPEEDIEFEDAAPAYGTPPSEKK